MAAWSPLRPWRGMSPPSRTLLINLPLILQAGEIPRSPIGLPHRMEVGRIYTENNEIFKREGEKKKPAVSIFKFSEKHTTS